MDRALIKFYNLLDVANAYNTNIPLYMFLRDCAFRNVYEAISSNLCNEEIKQNINKIYSEFQMEISQYQWNFFNMQKDLYMQFLEFFYSNINFETADEKLLNVCLDIIDNLKFFGTFDDLSLKRIEYFNKKINNLKLSQVAPSQPFQQPSVNPQPIQQNVNNNNINNANQNLSGMNQMPPQSNKPFVPIVNNGRVPKKVRGEFRLPMKKTDPQYPQLRDQIAEHIEYANLELDYHKVSEARDHLEAAAYYLRNVVD